MSIQLEARRLRILRARLAEMHAINSYFIIFARAFAAAFARKVVSPKAEGIYCNTYDRGEVTSLKCFPLCQPLPLEREPVRCRPRLPMEPPVRFVHDHDVV